MHDDGGSTRQPVGDGKAGPDERPPALSETDPKAGQTDLDTACEIRSDRKKCWITGRNKWTPAIVLAGSMIWQASLRLANSAR
jgi:hypothetical protein